jgi:hypothetical protein
LIGQKFEWCVAQEGDTCPLIHEKRVDKERKGKNKFGEGGYLKEKKRMRGEVFLRHFFPHFIFFEILFSPKILTQTIPLSLFLIKEDSYPGFLFFNKKVSDPHKIGNNPIN